MPLQVLMATDALRLLFSTVGLGWAVDIMEIPLISKLVDWLYDFLSANRISLGNALDGIIAAKRIDLVRDHRLRRVMGAVAMASSKILSCLCWAALQAPHLMQSIDTGHPVGPKY